MIAIVGPAAYLEGRGKGQIKRKYLQSLENVHICKDSSIGGKG